MLAVRAVFALFLGMAAAADPKAPTKALGEGFRLYRAGDYDGAAAVLRSIPREATPNRDYVLYLLGESEFYGGHPEAARRRFEELAKASPRSGAGGGDGSRFADTARWRTADCLWAAGRRSEAGRAYASLLAKKVAGGDRAVARFRLAELDAARRPADARRLWSAIHAELPSHPLAEQARHRLGLQGARVARRPSDAGVTVSERLRRAEALSEGRNWKEALEELAALPAELSPSNAADRDYLAGMTRFRMRREYPRAAELLLSVAPRLSGERAVSAAFHGARALSRVDRDDEAIVGYQDVVRRYPRSRWAAEAQYLSGWLEFNRGRYREGLAALRTMIERFPRTPWADDAAWCLAFAHYLIDEPAEALEALARYAAMTSGEDAAARVRYWRARLLARLGRHDEARALDRETAGRGPLTYYGLLAQARLDEEARSAAGTGSPAAAPPASVGTPPSPPLPIDDPVVARADELLAAGMGVEAGYEIERGEAGIRKRLGGERAQAVLLDRYERMQGFRRAYQLTDARTSPPSSPPLAGSAGATRALWQAAYPLAYRDLVERFGPPAGNPDHLLYAIMRKESGFHPHDVSYADARGLLQMIPPTSAQVAAEMGVAFHADELFEPETNIRLGAAYIGALARKFGRQIPLIAGSYNAGPKAMARWCDQHGERPLDEMVELIAYAQTREYIKRVVGIYARYRHLYGPSPYRLSLKVDARYAVSGPEY